jgi:hypothetical protein
MISRRPTARAGVSHCDFSRLSSGVGAWRRRGPPRETRAIADLVDAAPLLKYCGRADWPALNLSRPRSRVYIKSL